MLKCSYIILLHNNENNVESLVESLEKISGDFRREYIFIDDGSSDNTLAKLKSKISSLPRSTIISQEHQGPAASVNKAVKLASGDYIHFVRGYEILRPHSTHHLINACKKLNTLAAIGDVSEHDIIESKVDKVKTNIITKPLKLILKGDELVSKLGDKASLISSELLAKIGSVDDYMYDQKMFLSLYASLHTDFAYTNYTISRSKTNNITDQNFYKHNNLKAIYYFIMKNEKVCKDYISEILSSLARFGSNSHKYKAYAFLNRFYKFMTLRKILAYYRFEIEKSFK